VTCQQSASAGFNLKIFTVSYRDALDRLRVRLNSILFVKHVGISLFSGVLV